MEHVKETSAAKSGKMDAFREISELKKEIASYKEFLNRLSPEIDRNFQGLIAGVTELEGRFEVIRWDNLILTNLLIIIHGIILQKFPAITKDPYYGKLESLMQALQSNELAVKQKTINGL